MVPANLKILKVLVEELHSAAGSRAAMEEAALEAAEEEGSDDEEWEDDPNTFDLGLGTTKQDLMAFAEETPYSNRQRDDETQAYLLQFFREAASKPGFSQLFDNMTAEEQAKLRSFG